MPLFQDPNTAMIALLIGVLGILFEFHAPGTILPGVVGAALVLLAAATLSQYPLSPGAVALIAVAVLLLALELKINTSGALAGLGAILLACGVYLIIDSPDPALHIRPAVAFSAALPVGLLTAFLLTVAARAAANKTATGAGQMIGTVGTVVAARGAGSPLRVQVAGEYWNACAAEDLPPGCAVRVTGVQGLQLSVQPVHDTMVSI